MRKNAICGCEILLPNTDDLTAFAVVACDQFTSDGKYWEDLAEFTKGKLSALDMVLPEYYLNGDYTEKLKVINENIKKYFYTANETPKGMILTVRETKSGLKRIGLVAGVDLDEYDYTKGAKPLIRPTEATIQDRIPPRLKIRKDAMVEFPHVMMFIDDEKKAIIEDLYANRDKLDKIYDFELNMDGGHLTGYFIKDYKSVEDKFLELVESERLKNKYGEDVPFMMAVGDGNHSLATAKTHWEDIKKTAGENHPARYALCEIVNIYDDGIYFEPIHRFIKGVNREKFVEEYKKISHGKERIYFGDELKFDGDFNVPETITATDKFILDYLNTNGGEVDYVHGDDEVKAFVDADGNSVAILFDSIEKSDLFLTVVKGGNLPKKTFSIGEAREKRYYLEGRKIVK